MIMEHRSSSRTRFAVGSLTRPTSYFAGANGEGITVVDFDGESGRFDTVSVTGGIDNPTYLSFDPSRQALYANSEVEGWNEGIVSAYKVDRTTGRLDYLNKQPTLGSITAHSSFSRNGKYLFVTNYSHEIAAETPRRAMAVFPIGDDGRLGPAMGSVFHEGRGPSEERQRVPHPHCAVIGIDGDVVSVADLGLDRILHYGFDDRTGTLATSPSEVTVLPPASGPRHLVVAPSGRAMYVINEMASTVAVLARESKGGPWTVAQILSTLPPKRTGPNHCAALHLSPDARHLYGSNRGDDSIVCFAVDAATSRLTTVGWTPSGGHTPRTFALTADGGHVVVANQDSDELAAFRRNADTGELTPLNATYSVGTPMCIIEMNTRVAPAYRSESIGF